MGIREELSEVNEDMLFLTEEVWDRALIGYVKRFGLEPIALYDQAAILTELIAQGLSYEESVEHFEFNMIGAWDGEGTPAFAIVMNRGWVERQAEGWKLAGEPVSD